MAPSRRLYFGGLVGLLALCPLEFSYGHSLLFLLRLLISVCSLSINGARSEMKPIIVLNEQISELGSYLSRENKVNLEISKWSIYQQIEHILLVNTQVLEMVEAGKTPEDQKSRSILSYVTLTFGFIPRGRAESPNYVLPESSDKNDLLKLIEKFKAQLIRVKSLETFNSNEVVGNHPYFGGLSRSEWLRFIEIHTRHHLKIIRDIDG